MVPANRNHWERLPFTYLLACICKNFRSFSETLRLTKDRFDLAAFAAAFDLDAFLFFDLVCGIVSSSGKDR